MDPPTYTSGFLLNCKDAAVKQFVMKVHQDVKELSKGREVVVLEDLGPRELFVAQGMRDLLEDRINAFLRNDVSGTTCTGAGRASVVAKKK